MESLAWLLGTWIGEGVGEYPTISDFTYREETTFSHPRPDKPFFAYVQRTWLLPDDALSHSEMGYLRGIADDRAELVIAQPGGRVEVNDGTVAGSRIELASLLVGCTPTAKPVTEVRRLIERRANDTLWYRLDMAAMGEALLFHCEATLHRADT